MNTPQDLDAAVLAQPQDGVLVLTIQAPQLRNSLQAPGVLDGLIDGLTRLEQDTRLRCAVLTGAGGSFCSGGDLKMLAEGSEDETRLRMTRNAWLYRRLALCDKPIIAAVDGPAYGAGLGLATACDLIVAGQDAVFCSAFTRVGAMPDAALFWSLPARVGVAQARRMMLLACEIAGARAVEMGLADEYVEAGSALPAAMALARQLAQGPARPYGRIKAGLRRGPMTLEEALDFQLDNAPGLFASADFQEGASAFFAKRRPYFGQA